MPWGASAKDHLLASYKDAMISIMLRQFDQSKGFKDGMQVRPSASNLMSLIICTTARASCVRLMPQTLPLLQKV